MLLAVNMEPIVPSLRVNRKIILLNINPTLLESHEIATLGNSLRNRDQMQNRAYIQQTLIS